VDRLVTQPKDNIAVREELLLGRRMLTASFQVSPPHTLGAGELLAFSRSSNTISHLVSGWACRFRDFPDGHKAIVEIYLPGDLIGLERVLFPWTAAGVMSLTSVTMKVIDAKDGLVDLMSRRSTALYVAWLLSRGQRRSDHLLSAISGLDARGRLATMVLDFYKRLRRQKLIMGSTYHLPLTQIQIGAYLGLTVAHVNRVLRSFRDEEIAHLEKHCVTILDLERLLKLAQNGPIASSSGVLEGRLTNEPISLYAHPAQISGIPGSQDLPHATAGVPRAPF